MPNTQITVPLTSIGGTPPYTYSVIAGISTTFPGTITVNNTASTLFLDTLNPSPVNAGTYTIKLQVADSLGNLFDSIISVVVDDPTIFSILNDNQSFAPGVFPVNFTIPLISSGGNGTITWSIIPSITTLPNPTIDASNNLKFTLTNFGSFTVGLNATDSIGNSVSSVVSYSINSSTVYSLVDGQIEALVNAPIDNLGTHHFTATVRDAASTSFQGTTFYQALTPISGIHIPEAYFDHYWGPGDTLAIVFPVQGNFSGFALGSAVITQPSNGLTVTVDNINKVAKVAGPPTLFQNSQTRIPLPILQGTTQVAVVSREYTLLSDNTTNNGTNFTFTAFTRPYIVGDFVGLNPLKPYFNSPNIAKNSGYTVRVQTGSALPPGVSLDANTSLLYGNLVGVAPVSSILEYIDAQNLVHGTVTINWALYNSQFTLTDNLVAAQIQVPYPTATATTNCISSNSPAPLTTVSLVAGVMPAGLTLSVDNTINSPIGVVKITGTPTEAGYFDCWFAVSNSNGQTAYLYKRFTSNFISPLVILTGTITALVTGSPYVFSLQGFGGVPPYTWTSTQWPGGVNSTFPGITLSTSGVLSGTTTASDGTSQNDTFILTDSTGTTTQAVLNVNVNDTLRITTTILPIIVPGQPYSFFMSALGGSGGYTWSDDGNVPPSSSPSPPLPTGIAFSPSTGAFSGVTAASPGSQTLTMKVKDSGGHIATQTFTLTVGVASGLQIDTSGVGQVNRGVSYQGRLRVFGPGTAPFSWQIPPSSPNQLPTGLIVTPDTNSQGVTATISGVYSGVAFTNLPVEVEAIDTNGNAAFAYVLLSSGTDLQITTPSLPAGTTTAAYSTQIQASGGVPPYTFSLDISSPALPAGFSLSSSGVLSGTTGAAYNQNLVIDVNDNLSPSNLASKTLNLLIQASTLNIVTASPLPQVTSGLAYSTTLTASGGSPSYTFTISPLSTAVLPTGLSLSPTGTISGTTTQSNIAVSPTFRVTDSIGAFFDKTLTINVQTGLTLKTGIDFTDGTSTLSLGFIGNGNVNSINPNPDHAFFVYASGVLSTQPSQLQVQLGGLAGASATVNSITSGVATIQLNGPFQNGAQGSNNLTVTITDQGVTISATFTWTVYTNLPIALFTGSGSFPTLSPTFGGTNQPYIPVLEATPGHIYIGNGANTYTFQTYNGQSVSKPAAAGTVITIANPSNTEWQGRLAVIYDGTALSNAGAFELNYNGASLDPNVISTQMFINGADVAWYFNTGSANNFDLYTVNGGTGSQSTSAPVYWLVNPSTAAAVTVAPTSLNGNGTQQTLTISMVKPFPPLQSDTIASIIWGGTVLTTNSIVPIYTNGIPGSVTSYQAQFLQYAWFSSSGTFGGPKVITLPSSVTVGNTIILSINEFDYQGGFNPTVTDNRGNTYHLCGFVGSNTNEQGSLMYYAHVSSGGSGLQITVSGLGSHIAGANNAAITLIGAEFGGLLVPESIDAYNAFNASGTSFSANTGTVFTNNANDIIFTNGGLNSQVTPPAGFTIVVPSPGALSPPDSFGDRFGGALAFRQVAGVGSYSPTWPANFGSGNTVAFKLNPIVTLVPNNSGIVGFTVQVTPPVIHNVNSSLNLTLHGVITYLSGDSFVTNDVTYMNNVNVASIHIV